MGNKAAYEVPRSGLTSSDSCDKLVQWMGEMIMAMHHFGSLSAKSWQEQI